MSYFIVVLMSSVMDVTSLKVYIEKWLGTRELRISRTVFWSIFAFLEIAVGVGIFLTIDVMLEEVMIGSGVAHAVIMFVFICLYDVKIISCVSTFLTWAVGFAGSSGMSYMIVITTEQELYDGDIVHLIAVMDLYAKFMLMPILIIILVTGNFLSGRYSFKQLISALITPIISCYLYMIIPDQIVFLSGYRFIFVLVIVLVLNILNYYLFDNMVENYSLKNRVEMLEYQLDHQADKYEQLVLSYRKTGSMVHDIKKHISYIRVCIENGEYDKIKAVCDAYEKEIQSKYVLSRSGNLVIDTFVNSTYNFAQINGVRFDTNINIGEHLNVVSDYDMCIIIGNLLDNSINACRRQREKKNNNLYIKLSIVQTARYLIINIKNSNVNLITGEKRSISHGYGIQNVRNIVDNYDGIVDIKQSQQEYETSVLIPNEQNTGCRDVIKEAGASAALKY